MSQMTYPHSNWNHEVSKIKLTHKHHVDNLKKEGYLCEQCGGYIENWHEKLPKRERRCTHCLPSATHMTKEQKMDLQNRMALDKLGSRKPAKKNPFHKLLN